LQSPPPTSGPTPEVEAGIIAANEARRAAEAEASGSDHQHSSTDEAMKDPNDQDDNCYKPSDNSEGDEKEAIK
jgi:hypothetical protein